MQISTKTLTSLLSLLSLLLLAAAAHAQGGFFFASNATAFLPLSVDYVYTGSTSTAGTTMSDAIANASAAANNCVPGGLAPLGCQWQPVPGGAHFTVGANQPICNNLGPVKLNNGGPNYAAGALHGLSIGFDNTNATIFQLYFYYGLGPSNITFGECLSLGLTSMTGGDDYDAQVVFDSVGDYTATQIANSQFSTPCLRIESTPGAIHSPACIPVSLPGTYLVSNNYNMTTGLSIHGVYVSGGSIAGAQWQTCNIAFAGGGGGTAVAVLSATNTINLFTGLPTTTWSSGPTTGVLSNGTATCSGTVTITSTVGGLGTLSVHNASSGALIGQTYVAAPGGGVFNDILVGNNEGQPPNGSTTYIQNLVAAWTGAVPVDIYSVW